MFRLHRSLLIAYITMLSVNYFTAWMELTATGNAYYLWFALSNLTDMLAFLCESAIYYLVVSLMLPFTEEQMKRREEFQKFLFGGFLDAN